MHDIQSEGRVDKYAWKPLGCARGGGRGGRHPDMSSQGKEKDNYMQRMTGGGERGSTEMKTGPDRSPRKTRHSSEHHTEELITGPRLLKAQLMSFQHIKVSHQRASGLYQSLYACYFYQPG